MAENLPPIHLRLRGKIDQATERLALRAVLTASHLFGLAAGTYLRQLRNANDPLTDAYVRLHLAELRAHLAWEVVDILAARFARVPEKRRPYYSPAQRFRILEIKNTLAWNADKAAQIFLICSNTLRSWERTADPHARTVGAAVTPVPPVRRAADIVRSVAQTMTRLGFGGRGLVARTLARAGWNVSARSIGRYQKETVVLPTALRVTPPCRTRPVTARFTHHTWMLDVSEVRQFLGAPLYMAGVFDAFSRIPLALRTFDHKPNARDMAALLKQTAKRYVAPKYVVTDLGGEFTGGVFRNAVRRLGAVHRFAAADSIKATARLERFWRTLKETAGIRAVGLPLDRDDLEQRLGHALVFYIAFRPHEGLGGATPAEAFLGVEPAHKVAVEPPRGQPGDGPRDAPFIVEYVDPQQRLAILKPIK